MCASSRLTWRGTHSSPVWSISRACGAPSRRPGSSSPGTGCTPRRTARPGRRAACGSGPGTRSTRRRPRCPRRCQSTNLRTSGGQVGELREGVRRLAQHGALGVAEDAVPGLLRVVRVRPGELDRVLEVLVVDVQELSVARRLASRFWTATGPVRGRPRSAISRRSQTLRPRAGVDAAPDLLERRAGARTPRAPRRSASPTASDGLDDPQRGQQLEVEPDPHEPARVGEVVALVDDVADQRARVELGLVGADQQDREPRVVGVREAGRPGARCRARRAG